MDEIPWPFVGSEAIAARLISERRMRSAYWALFPDVYVPRGAVLTAQDRAIAAWLWSKRRAVVAGQSAAVLLGAKWVDAAGPAELVHDNRRPPPRLVVRSDTLRDDEVLAIGGMTVTTPARTAFDIGRHTAARVAAVQRLDALANATSVARTQIEAVAAAHPGARGLARLREILPLIDAGAESPRETVAW